MPTLILSSILPNIFRDANVSSCHIALKISIYLKTLQYLDSGNQSCSWLLALLEICHTWICRLKTLWGECQCHLWTAFEALAFSFYLCHTFPYHTTHAYSVTWSSKHLCAKNWMWSNVAEISSLISTSSAWYTSFGFGYCTLGSIYIQLTFVIVWTQNWWKINQILLPCDFNLRWFTLE